MRLVLAATSSNGTVTSNSPRVRPTGYDPHRGGPFRDPSSPPVAGARGPAAAAPPRDTGRRGPGGTEPAAAACRARLRAPSPHDSAPRPHQRPAHLDERRYLQ